MTLRDSWCTPRKITKRLPKIDLDPCSNPRSTVPARRHCMLERGENGLLISWEGLSVFCNPPWSDVMPFALKAWEADSFCFLVLEDSSTRWWRMLSQFDCYRFSFYTRVGFRPPPGVESSTNDRPTCMIADPSFRSLVGDRFNSLGRWWKKD